MELVLLCGKLAKPGEDRLRAHDLAASPAFLGGQLLALERQPPPLLGVQFDAGLAGRRHKNLLEDPDLLLQVLHLPRHPRALSAYANIATMNWSGAGSVKSGPYCPAPRRSLKPPIGRRIMRQSATMAFLSPRGTSTTFTARSGSRRGLRRAGDRV
jgi:hypothetical protein